MIMRALFEKGKKSPPLMKLMATFYNLLSFNRIRIKGKKNTISRSYSFFRKNRITIIGNNNLIKFGLGTRITNCHIYIYGNNHRLLIGDNCYCENSEFYFEDIDYLISLGYKTNALSVHFAVTEPNSKITIGERSLFSSDVEVRTGDSHSIIDIATSKRINYAKDVIMGAHVWVGAHSRILKGSKISKDSIVANSAVVTKKFEIPNCIIEGFPAKVIRQGINWQNQRIYES